MQVSPASVQCIPAALRAQSPPSPAGWQHQGYVAQAGMAGKIAHVVAWALALEADLSIYPRFVPAALAVTTGSLEIVWGGMQGWSSTR